MGISRGVLILNVPKGSNAARAGLRGSSRGEQGDVTFGDVIIGLGERCTASDAAECTYAEVKDERDLFRALERFEPGERVSLRIGRMAEGGKEVELTVELTLQALEGADDGLLPLDKGWGVLAGYEPPGPERGAAVWTSLCSPGQGHGQRHACPSPCTLDLV